VEMSKKDEEKLEEKLEEKDDLSLEEEISVQEDDKEQDIQEGGEEDKNSADCQELETKVKELEELRLRDLADYENLKKRMEKEKSQSVAYAHESFARDLLSVIDSLDSAASLEVDEENLNESLEKIREGINLTIEQFKKVFEKNGIELVDVENGFDPNFHEAIMQVDSDEHKKGEIVRVFQKGYKIRDRILRPAMVSICK
jgi:molecular chaperone GrpE